MMPYLPLETYRMQTNHPYLHLLIYHMLTIHHNTLIL